MPHALNGDYLDIGMYVKLRNGDKGVVTTIKHNVLPGHTIKTTVYIRIYKLLPKQIDTFYKSNNNIVVDNTGRYFHGVNQNSDWDVISLWGYATLKQKKEEAMKEVGEKMDDKINPNHYKVGGIETWDYIKAKLSPTQLYGGAIFNVIKYISRADHKNKLEDLKKAKWYLDKIIEEIEKGQKDDNHNTAIGEAIKDGKLKKSSSVPSDFITIPKGYTPWNGGNEPVFYGEVSLRFIYKDGTPGGHFTSTQVHGNWNEMGVIAYKEFENWIMCPGHRPTHLHGDVVVMVSYEYLGKTQTIIDTVDRINWGNPVFKVYRRRRNCECFHCLKRQNPTSGFVAYEKATCESCGINYSVPVTSNKTKII